MRILNIKSRGTGAIQAGVMALLLVAVAAALGYVITGFTMCGWMLDASSKLSWTQPLRCEQLTVAIVPLEPGPAVKALLPAKATQKARQAGALCAQPGLDQLGVALAGFYPFSYRVREALTIPDEYYDQRRGQYRIDQVLDWMVKQAHPSDYRTLGVLSADVYSPGYNFLFGLSTHGGAACVSSSCRMVGGGQGKKTPERRWHELVGHELGHALGMNHNPDWRSIMHFANSLKDLDRQGCELLPDDRAVLRAKHRVRWPGPGEAKGEPNGLAK
jgi:predicted Zn-dependent protease